MVERQKRQESETFKRKKLAHHSRSFRFHRVWAIGETSTARY